MKPIFFDEWDALLRTLVLGVLAYASLVALLRVSGNRTLSKMNAFDLVVTVALGSTLATSLLSDRVTVAQSALAFGLLIGLQFAITWTSARATWVKKLVTGEPALLLYQGEVLDRALRRSRVTREEVAAAVRSAGIGRVDEAGAVVLETDGSFSVVPQDPQGEPVRLRGIAIPGSSS